MGCPKFFSEDEAWDLNIYTSHNSPVTTSDRSDRACLMRKDTKKPPKSQRAVRARRNTGTVADIDPVPTGAPEPGIPSIPRQ